MNKLTSIRIKQNDGTYSDDILVQVLADNVVWTQGSTVSLLDILGQVQYETKGSIQHQIDTISIKQVEDARIGATNTQYSDLKTRLDDEYVNLQNRIAAVATDLRTETGTRSNEDTAIRASISAQATTRQNNDTTLSNQIITEVNARKNGDDVLTKRISAEESARQTADNTLQSNINAEVSARQTADSTMSAQIAQILNTNGVIDIQHGALAVQAAAGATNFTCTFPRAFSSVPNVVATVRVSGNTDSQTVKITSTTTSNFAGTVFNAGTATVSAYVEWVATIGDTDLNSEITDARVGANSEIYNTLGEAIREQDMDLKKVIVYDNGAQLPAKDYTDTGDNLTTDYTPTANSALKSDGHGYAATGWSLYKYTKKNTLSGSVIHVKADGNCQFQTGVGVPATGDITRIGDTYPAFDIYLEWPEEGNCLVIASMSEPYIHSCSLNPDLENKGIMDALGVEHETLMQGAYLSENPITASFTVDTSLIKADGYSCYDAGYKVYKYGATTEKRGKVYRIKAEGTFQFQTSLTIPRFGTKYIVGGTYQAGDVYVVWPSEAGYLIVSSRTEPVVSECGDIYSIDDKVMETRSMIGAEISSIANGKFDESPLAPGWTTANSYLGEDGYSTTKTGWTVYKYTLLALGRNKIVHIVGGFQSQFQTGIGTTSSGAGTIIAGPSRSDDIYWVWPVNATYLMVCAQSEPTVTICTDRTGTLMSESFTPAAESSQGANTGDKVRIMSYNVAHYNYDTSLYISDDKVLNFRQMIAKANVDYVCTQEDAANIDGDTGSKPSVDYVFNPVLPFTVSGGSETMIHSRFLQSTEAHHALCFATRRWLDYATFDYGAKKLLIVTAHFYPGSETEAITNRAVEVSELFKWISGEVDLQEYKTTDDGAWIHVPTHTHCIICIDGNTETTADKNTLQSEATNANFLMGNGGRFGWFKTAYNNGTGARSSIDNVIVSSNIIINDISVLWDWFERLYSDHAPVVADVTLT